MCWCRYLFVDLSWTKYEEQLGSSVVRPSQIAIARHWTLVMQKIRQSKDNPKTREVQAQKTRQSQDRHAQGKRKDETRSTHVSFQPYFCVCFLSLFLPSFLSFFLLGAVLLLETLFTYLGERRRSVTLCFFSLHLSLSLSLPLFRSLPISLSSPANGDKHDFSFQNISCFCEHVVLSCCDPP
jgi:hypothetical protein